MEFTLLGDPEIKAPSAAESYVCEQSDMPPLGFECLNRFILRSTVYHTRSYNKSNSKKSIDCAVERDSNNHFGVVERIFVSNDEVYVILRNFVLTSI